MRNEVRAGREGGPLDFGARTRSARVPDMNEGRSRGGCTMKRIGVLGSGQVAQVLAKGFQKHGYDVRVGSRSPAKLAAFASSTGIASGTFAEVAAWAEGIVLAVLGG